MRCGGRLFELPVHALALAIGVAALLPGPARADEIDWQPIGEVETVDILSHDADGGLRETRTWIVVLEGAGYVRSASRGLFANIDRDPNVALRVGDREIPVRAARNDDPALAERVEAAHKEKYPDCPLCRLFQLRAPRVVELTARP